LWFLAPSSALPPLPNLFPGPADLTSGIHSSRVTRLAVTILALRRQAPNTPLLLPPPEGGDSDGDDAKASPAGSSDNQDEGGNDDGDDDSENENDEENAAANSVDAAGSSFEACLDQMKDQDYSPTSKAKSAVSKNGEEKEEKMIRFDDEDDEDKDGDDDVGDAAGPIPEQTHKLSYLRRKVLGDSYDAAIAEGPESQRAGLRTLFSAIDKDNSGDIDKDELYDALQKLSSHTLTRDEFHVILKHMDADGSGEVDLDELCAFFFPEGDGGGGGARTPPPEEIQTPRRRAASSSGRRREGGGGATPPTKTPPTPPTFKYY
jgi:hypothetical protein